MSPHDPIDPRRGHSLWIDDDVVGLDPVARLADRSNLPRRDPRVTNTGGGHTISKIEERGVATDDLRSPLATFYAQRTLTGAPSRRPIRRTPPCSWPAAVCPRPPVRLSPWAAA